MIENQDTLFDDIKAADKVSTEYYQDLHDSIIVQIESGVRGMILRSGCMLEEGIVEDICGYILSERNIDVRHTLETGVMKYN